MGERQKSLLELNAAVLLWAGTALFSKWIALSAGQITAWRSVIAALALLGFLRWQGQRLATRHRRDLGLLVAGGAALGIHWITYFHSMQIATVAIGIVALHTYPVMTALVEPLVNGERPAGIDVLLGLVVLLGVIVLVPDFSPGNRVAQGVLIGTFSAACFAARNLLTKPVVKTYGGGTVMLYQLATTAALLLPALPLLNGPPVTVRASWQLVLLGVLFTALPHTLFTNSLRHLKAKTVSLIAALLPIYGTVAAAWLLGERPSTRTVIGGAMVLTAVFAETWRVVRRTE